MLLLAFVFQRGPHQIAVMLPGEIYVVNVFSRDLLVESDELTCPVVAKE